ncbi:MAG: NTP transferase domain-containing protein [Pseudomonadota bacterium]
MATKSYLEHPEDVLDQWLTWSSQGAACLAVVTATEGGAVRAAGALMAISELGDVAGYVSGGCIDADVRLHALDCIESGQAKALRYGAGSPFKDLPLPCGGAIEIALLPSFEIDEARRCLARLRERLPARFEVSAGSRVLAFTYEPKLRLRIAGRGADAIALAEAAESCGIETQLALRDDEDVALAEARGLKVSARLGTPSSLPPMTDDAWTAFVLMFHDGDWEGALLRQALSGPAFYIGAVGSARTHQRRRAHLRELDLPEGQIERVRGPIGLVPSMRNASFLAISVLAEIIEAYAMKARTNFETTAVVMLAAGQARRFEHGDKLMAALNGKPLIDHALGSLSGERVARRLGVVGPGHDERQRLLEAAGWQVLENPHAVEGQGTSLAAAARHLQSVPGIDAMLVMLADMPNVPGDHLMALREAMEDGVEAVMTEVDGVLCPPALFSRSVFSDLAQLGGDQGARALFEKLSNTRTVALDAALAVDVDTVADLNALCLEHADG